MGGGSDDDHADSKSVQPGATPGLPATSEAYEGETVT